MAVDQVPCVRNEDMAETIIVWGDYASLDNMGTFRTWTLKVEGNGFEAENLTISNDAGQVGQAVALHVEGDYAIFRNCRILDIGRAHV